ncbi:AEC family transporter [Entamoeba marina]
MTSVVEQFGTLVFIITASYIVKIIWFRDVIKENSKLIMKIAFNLALPCVVFKALINTHSLNADSMAMFIGGWVFEFVSACVSFITFKFILKSEVPWQLQFGTCFGLNIGLFLFPILEAIDGVNGISSAVLFNLSNDFVGYCILRPIYALLENTNDNPQEDEVDDIIVELPKEDEEELIKSIQYDKH